MPPVVVAVVEPDGRMRQLRVDPGVLPQLVAELVGAGVVEVALHTHLIAWHGSQGGGVNVVATALGRTFRLDDLAVRGPVVVAGGRDNDAGVRGLTGEQLAGLAVVCRFWSDRSSTTVPRK